MSYTIEHSEHIVRYMDVKLSNRLTAEKAEQFIRAAHFHHIGDDEDLWGEYAICPGGNEVCSVRSFSWIPDSTAPGKGYGNLTIRYYPDVLEEHLIKESTFIANVKQALRNTFEE